MIAEVVINAGVEGTRDRREVGQYEVPIGNLLTGEMAVCVDPKTLREGEIAEVLVTFREKVGT